MTTRSAQLLHFKTVARRAPSDAAVVPANERWIVKTVYVYNGSLADSVVYAQITFADGSGSAVLMRHTIPTGQVWQWEGWAVAEPGDSIHVGGQGVDNVFVVSGTKLPVVS